MKPVHVTDATFENEVLKSDLPVLVDFWAPWCGPCQMIAPVINELAVEFDGKVKITKMNTDENFTASRYGIRGIPTLLIFKQGQVVDHIVGAVPKSTISEKLKYYSEAA
jgi:thioredoxin 1